MLDRHSCVSEKMGPKTLVLQVFSKSSENPIIITRTGFSTHGTVKALENLFDAERLEALEKYSASAFILKVSRWQAQFWHGCQVHSRGSLLGVHVR